MIATAGRSVSTEGCLDLFRFLRVHDDDAGQSESGEDGQKDGRSFHIGQIVFGVEDCLVNRKMVEA